MGQSKILTVYATIVALHPRKRSHDDRAEDEGLNSSREGPESPSSVRTKTRHEQQETNSPGMSNGLRDAMPHKYAKTVSYPSASMDTDSPPSYPKHVIVPSPPDSNEQRQQPLGPHRTGNFMEDSPTMKKTNEKVVTPIRNHEPRQLGHAGFTVPAYRSQGGGYPQRGEHYQRGDHPQRGDGYGYGYYHNPSEIEPGPPYGHGHNTQVHPKRWACDYCRVATFGSFEEACAHEGACATRYGVVNRQRPYPTHGPPPYPHHQQHSGLGNLYQATQEVRHYSPRMPPPPHHDNFYHNTPPPPPPHRYPHAGGWGAAPPSIPSERTGYQTISPRFQDYRMYDDRHDMGHHQGYQSNQSNQRRMLLAMPGDSESLSDRQCHVRSEFVEVFAATDNDVSVRHSKGAQKLMLGQVGIRCIHCAHLRPKDRAERAICYPSSISRIYQTVADMQRFHFEHCREIPDETRKRYKSLKTTRPRGVGSPQTYWVQSAKLLNLVDSEAGICFGAGNKHDTS